MNGGRHHVTTVFPTEYVRAKNDVLCLIERVESRGDVVTAVEAVAGGAVPRPGARQASGG